MKLAEQEITVARSGLNLYCEKWTHQLFSALDSWVNRHSAEIEMEDETIDSMEYEYSAGDDTWSLTSSQQKIHDQLAAMMVHSPPSASKRRVSADCISVASTAIIQEDQTRSSEKVDFSLIQKHRFLPPTVFCPEVEQEELAWKALEQLVKEEDRAKSELELEKRRDSFSVLQNSEDFPDGDSVRSVISSLPSINDLNFELDRSSQNITPRKSFDEDLVFSRPNDSIAPIQELDDKLSAGREIVL